MPVINTSKRSAPPNVNFKKCKIVLGQTKIQTIILRIPRTLKNPIQTSGAKTVTGGHLTNHPNTDTTLEIVRHPGNRHPSDTAAMRKRDPR